MTGLGTDYFVPIDASAAGSWSCIGRGHPGESGRLLSGVLLAVSARLPIFVTLQPPAGDSSERRGSGTFFRGRMVKPYWPTCPPRKKVPDPGDSNSHFRRLKCYPFSFWCSYGVGMRKQKILSGPALLVVAAVMAAVLAALAVGLGSVQERFLTRYWRDRLASATDEEVPALMRAAAAFGDMGLPALVAALGTDRQVVAREGYRRLRWTMDEWELLPPRAVAAKLVRLARLLGTHAIDFEPTGQALAADLARRILKWPGQTPPDGHDRLLAYCEQVLIRPGSDPAAVVAAVDTGGIDSLRAELFQKAAADLPRNRQTIRQVSGAGLPGRAPPAPDRLLPPVPEPGRQAPDAAPAARDDLSDGRQLPGTDRSPRSAERDTPALVDADPDMRPLSNSAQPAPASSGSQPPAGAATGSQVAGLAADLGRLETIDVMRQLHGAGPGVKTAAEAELAARGFGSVELELAWQLTDPQPSVRQGLLERLPTTPAVDTSRWLLWLCRDESADVRLAALSLLATTADPRLLRQVEQMAHGDSDPRIAKLAERLGPRVRGTNR